MALRKALKKYPLELDRCQARASANVLERDKILICLMNRVKLLKKNNTKRAKRGYKKINPMYIFPSGNIVISL